MTDRRVEEEKGDAMWVVQHNITYYNCSPCQSLWAFIMNFNAWMINDQCEVSACLSRIFGYSVKKIYFGSFFFDSVPGPLDLLYNSCRPVCFQTPPSTFDLFTLGSSEHGRLHTV